MVVPDDVVCCESEHEFFKIQTLQHILILLLLVRHSNLLMLGELMTLSLADGLHNVDTFVVLAVPYPVN